MKTHYVLFAALALTACAAPTPQIVEETPAPEDIDIGILWTEYSAEYQAVSAQVYAVARRDLPRLLADP